jgi:hypothetical protein
MCQLSRAHKDAGSERTHRRSSRFEPPPPKYLAASAVEHPKSCRSARPRAVVSSAKRREHVWRADGNLLQDFRSLAGWPAKILNSELVAIRYLRDYARWFVLVAVLRGRLALPPSGDFAVLEEIGVDGRPNRGVKASGLASTGGNRQNAAWFFRRRVGTNIPFLSALLGAIRSKPVKKRSEGASDDGKGDYQARLPRHRSDRIFRRSQWSPLAIQSRPPGMPAPLGRGQVSVVSAPRQIETASRCGHRQSYIRPIVLRCVNPLVAPMLQFATDSSDSG